MSRWTTPMVVGVLQRFGRLDAEPGDGAEEVAAPWLDAQWSRARPRAVVGMRVWTAGGQGPVALRGLRSRSSAFAGRCDHFRQRLAVDELHGVEVDAALAADGVDRHDVGVVQLAGGRLRSEARQLPRRRASRRRAAP